jgi:hypothetical protein
MASVVEKRVHGLLKHALLVADDDFRSLKLQERLETIVAIDDATVKIVQIGRGKAAPFEGDERAQVGRNDRQHVENHPFRTGL